MDSTLRTFRLLSALIVVNGITGICGAFTGDSTERALRLTFATVTISLGVGLWFTKPWARTVGLVLFGLLATWNVYLLVADGFSPRKLVVLLFAVCFFSVLLL